MAAEALALEQRLDVASEVRRRREQEKEKRIKQAS
jgi:hypothetical protein